MSRLVELEHHDPDADLLVVTNMWPCERDPRYGIFVKRQVDSLRAAGVRCDVLFVRGDTSPLAYAAAALRVLRLSLGRRRRYRAFHGHGGETAVIAPFFRGPRIVSFCGDDLLGTPDAREAVSRSSRIKATVLAQLSRTLSRSVTKSRELENALPARVRERNLVLPNGVDRTTFQPVTRDEARRELGWPVDAHIALFAGDPAIARKRHALAAAACEDAAARLGTPVRLEVANTVPGAKMPLVMSAADCLLMTSSIEGSPNVVKEAVTCSLPVVSVPVGDVREVLEPVEPSWVCDPTPAALGAAVAECLTRGERSNGRERSAWLDERRIAERLLALYDEAAGPRTSPVLATG